MNERGTFRFRSSLFLLRTGAVGRTVGVAVGAHVLKVIVLRLLDGDFGYCALEMVPSLAQLAAHLIDQHRVDSMEPIARCCPAASCTCPWRRSAARCRGTSTCPRSPSAYYRAGSRACRRPPTTWPRDLDSTWPPCRALSSTSSPVDGRNPSLAPANESPFASLAAPTFPSRAPVIG